MVDSDILVSNLHMPIYLTFGEQMVKLADNKEWIVFYNFFLENRAWHFLWIACLGEDSHEIWSHFYEENF